MRELSELVEAAQAGDSEAYDALIERFQHIAYATAYRYMGDHHLAQDIVQDAVIEAFVHLPRLKEPGAFPGWFRQIVFRQCTRALRQTTLPFVHPFCASHERDDTMHDELDPTPELQALVEQLSTNDWRMALTAETALTDAGQPGIDAVLWALSHPNARVRRGCVGFLDHHGTDACFASLQQAALHDPAAPVRRVAVHSASCQRCKPRPLTGDLVGLLVQVALSDTSRRVRENAIGGLGVQPQDARAIAALEQILRTETDPCLRKDAHHALKRQDPNYRARVDAEARKRGIERGAEVTRARKEH